MELGEARRHRFLGGVVRGPEGDVMDRARAGMPARSLAILLKGDEPAERRAAGVAYQCPLAPRLGKAEHVGEDRSGRAGLAQPQGHAMEATNCLVVED